ncbi:hypothetical protein K490DRAFT_74827 [Saccharata proteae CBS 121410]|uniref:LsmAD domain-containing protein n=1 Tax=Saccharata proteae CBS 121410 TaxID=1314787 RepID=A0A9P4HUQ2_9PEZI|nr:hypothetical protein K490DRAFT_74827 [Saccharata proteae CBS 121410]
MASPNVTNGNAAASAVSAGNKAQLKTAGGKAVEGTRKQTSSPIDGAQRKPPAQKAWTSGTNPITQRPSNPTIPNGAAGANKAPAGAKGMASTPKDAAPSDNNRHAHDRMLFLLGSFTGLVTNITLKNGEQFSGVFHGASLEQQEHRYTIKMAKRVQSAQANGASDNLDEYCGVGEDHVLTFEVKDVVDLSVDNVVTDKAQAKPRNGAASAFRTDADISGNLEVRERELQPWLPSNDTDVDLSLEGSGGGWDQFETNERLYGAQSTYDEEIYTTKIDRNNPLYKQRAAQAERIAREIESGVSSNSHIAEERGQNSVDDSGMDEEEKYSGVRRANHSPLSSGQPNKYTPPARRAPTSQPTVTGAPVDPAIISSQIARPGSTAAKAAQSPAPEQQSSDLAKAEERKSVPLLSTESTAAATNSATPATTTAPEGAKPSATADNADAKPVKPKNMNVENELLDRFKEFSASERMKVQDRQRHVARHDKNVKLNDLKKFAKNFSYSAPIPDDLIPILAKDPSKQQEIKQKSLQAVVERKTSITTGTDRPATTISGESKPQARTAGAPQAPALNQPRRNGPPYPQAPRTGQNIAQIPPRNGPGGLGQRLAITQQQHKAGGVMPPMPQPLPLHNMPPMGPSASSSGQHTPTSSASTRFNPKVTEFRPNPAASTFTPGEPSNSSSPRIDSAPSRPESRRIPTTSFWGASKPNLAAERPSLNNMFNPIKRMKKEAEEQNKVKDYATNGGIPQAYRTPPTWELLVPAANKDKSYVDMFDRSAITVQPVSAPQATLGNNVMPPVHTPQHTPRHPPVQPHHGPGGPHHFDGSHHMQFSASQSSFHPSPRAGMPQFIYGQQVQQGMPPFPQGMPFHMSPNVPNAAMRAQPGFVQQAPTMGGPIMMQPLNGPMGHMGQMGQMVQLPGNPQMQGVQMYSPVPHHVYPHASGPMPMHPAGSGFPSPRPPVAQMMSHQGSQQGHPQPQFMHPVPNGGAYPQFVMQPGNMTPMRGHVFPQPQPHFNSSPHQNHHFPNQQQQPHRGTPSGGYSQPMMPSQSMGGPQPMAGPPPPNVAAAQAAAAAGAVQGQHGGAGPDGGADKKD